MITKLHIKNFRSIEDVEMPLGKINVLTGANNSGKSSFIYALLTFKNIVSNPNRGLDSFFVYPPNTDGAINLGGWGQVIRNKDTNSQMLLEITMEGEGVTPEHAICYGVEIGANQSNFRLKWNEEVEMEQPVTFPYSGDATTQYTNPKSENPSWSIMSWNGLTLKMWSANHSSLSSVVDAPFWKLYKTDFLSVKRGFNKPSYGTVPMQIEVVSEDEIATLLALDHDLVGAIAHYLEKIVNRTFVVNMIPNTSIFYLQIRNKDTGFVTNLVNEGTGINQLVSMLAKILRKNSQFICVDEPEIHLHPSVINKFVDVLVEIAHKENKQILLSTHSEHIVTALMRNVSQQSINPDDVKVYYLTKDSNGTNVEHQPLNDKGQIAGGLKNFYEAELENISSLFGF